MRGKKPLKPVLTQNRFLQINKAYLDQNTRHFLYISYTKNICSPHFHSNKDNVVKIWFTMEFLDIHAAITKQKPFPNFTRHIIPQSLHKKYIIIILGFYVSQLRILLLNVFSLAALIIQPKGRENRP